MKNKFTNNLIHETSPYLLQHAHNPVNWNAWHPQVWEQAKKEHKLVLVSIGYSSCHWCHVMERESFEDEAVAQVMNEHFICIKVDREERPDVDQIFMDACQLITGRGGWPLNAFALPDGRPVYAGTYFPKENWVQVLLAVADYWENHKQDALATAAQIAAGIKGMDGLYEQSAEMDFEAADRTAFFEKFDAVWDYQKGGRRGAPKFAMPINLRYLLQNYYYTGNEKALKAVTVTLDNMMNGGIYDHVGGGFARYATDESWTIPHFEKMLYDNAQLVSLYADAYRVAPQPRYREVVEETLTFVEREMSDASGGFYSALDADSEGEEGAFYVWSKQELNAVLGDSFTSFQQVFPVSARGNFEGRNHLVRRPESAVSFEECKHWKDLLLHERAKRPRPALDNKALTSWNALMIKGYADAYRAFGVPSFLNRAQRCARFICDRMLQPDFSLKRSYKAGQATIDGFLDDYSFTCEAFLLLYELTFDEQWLRLAQQIADYAVQHFYHAAEQLFFYTSSNTELIVRKIETSDNVLPSSNSVMAKVLYRLGVHLEKSDYRQMAKAAVHRMRKNIAEHPAYYANWAMLADWFIQAPFEVALVGSDAETMRAEIEQHFLPGCIFAGSALPSSLPLLQDRFIPDATVIYVCQNNTCRLPVRRVAEALTQINEHSS